ncbi:MAG: hypothetical protein FWD22_06910 [Treponema sp.]|nr:hypothetical protein [Treponema sp.]
MKKLVVVLVLFFSATVIFANPIELGSFPIGRWLDPNYDAIWDFSTNNIRILCSKTGIVHYDFSTKTIEGFRAIMSGMQPGITYSCPEAGRSYRFIATLPNTNVTLQIDRPGQPQYSVTMQRQ